MSAELRPASADDAAGVRALHLAAFPEKEAESVAELAVALLTEKTVPETFSLVVEDDGSIVGHISVSPVWTEGDAEWQGYILAPLAVHPDQQASGLGSKLVQAGVDLLRRPNVHALFVYGDPKYYGRFGFSADPAEHFMPPHPPEFPFGWQVMMLSTFELPDAPTALVCVPALDDPGLW